MPSGSPHLPVAPLASFDVTFPRVFFDRLPRPNAVLPLFVGDPQHGSAAHQANRIQRFLPFGYMALSHSPVPLLVVSVPLLLLIFSDLKRADRVLRSPSPFLRVPEGDLVDHLAVPPRAWSISSVLDAFLRAPGSCAPIVPFFLFPSCLRNSDKRITKAVLRRWLSLFRYAPPLQLHGRSLLALPFLVLHHSMPGCWSALQDPYQL